MMTFNVVAMGDGTYGIVSSANVFSTKDEATAYVLKHCRNRDFGRRAQGEEKSDAQIAAIGRPLADALNRFAREHRDDDKKEIARLHTELCRAYREEMFDEVQEQW